MSLTAFSDLRRSLESGVILLDVEANSLSEVVNQLLDEGEMKGLTMPEVREPILRLFDMPENSLLQEWERVWVLRDRSESKKEGCKVYVTKSPVLKKPLVGLIRVKHPVVINEKGFLGFRYFLFVLGSVDCTSTQQWEFAPLRYR